MLAFAFIFQSTCVTVGISCYLYELFFHEATAHHAPGMHPSALRTSCLSRVLHVHLSRATIKLPCAIAPQKHRQVFKTSRTWHLACLRLAQRQEKCEGKCSSGGSRVLLKFYPYFGRALFAPTDIHSRCLLEWPSHN